MQSDHRRCEICLKLWEEVSAHEILGNFIKISQAVLLATATSNVRMTVFFFFFFSQNFSELFCLFSKEQPLCSVGPYPQPEYEINR